MVNTLKQKLLRGESTLGSWVTIPSPDISEALSTLPLDWLLFDLEHAPLTEQTAQVLMQAMRGDLVTPMVRVAWNDQVLLKRALDIGAHGVVIPMVNNAVDAEKAVRACKYPPKGIRGCGPKRPWIYDKRYLETADDEILVLVQIESVEAVANVDRILSVEGIDGVFVGPMDLSFSMGLRGSMDNPEFQSSIDTVLKAAKSHKKISGIWMGAGKSISERIAEGWQFISIGIDLSLLIAGAQSALNAARGSNSGS